MLLHGVDNISPLRSHLLQSFKTTRHLTILLDDKIFTASWKRLDIYDIYTHAKINIINVIRTLMLAAYRCINSSTMFSLCVQHRNNFILRQCTCYKQNLIKFCYLHYKSADIDRKNDQFISCKLSMHIEWLLNVVMLWFCREVYVFVVDAYVMALKHFSYYLFGFFFR